MNADTRAKMMAELLAAKNKSAAPAAVSSAPAVVVAPAPEVVAAVPVTVTAGSVEPAKDVTFTTFADLEPEASAALPALGLPGVFPAPGLGAGAAPGGMADRIVSYLCAEVDRLQIERDNWYNLYTDLLKRKD